MRHLDPSLLGEGSGRLATPAAARTEEIELRVGDATILAYWTEAAADAVGSGWAFLYAPGAGSNVHDPFGKFLSETLPAAGIALMRFEFPYQQARRRFPDKPSVLEATWSSAIASARPRAPRLAAGGRSMGGRYASYAAANGEPVDALVCFAYPLHPPGKTEQMRADHFPRIRVPMLVCSGTRDAFGSPDEIRAALAKVSASSLYLLEGADHSFAVLKSSGRIRAEVWREAAQATIDFLMLISCP